MSPAVVHFPWSPTSARPAGAGWVLAVGAGVLAGVFLPGRLGVFAATGIVAGWGVWVLVGWARSERRLRAESDACRRAAAEEAAARSVATDAAADSGADRTGQLEQVSARLRRAADAIKGNAERTAQADTLAGETQGLAERGVRELQAVGDAIEALNRSSEQISQILKTIDGIAFQTRLLALNAAVEAARAGEAGAGFAVVAEEVRRLAQHAAESAQETSGKVEETVNWIAQCEMLKTEISNTLNEVAGKTRDLAGVVTQVSQAAATEAGALGEVVNEVDALRQPVGADRRVPRRAAARRVLSENPNPQRGEVHHARLD